MPSQDIYEPPATDKTLMKLIQAIQSVSIKSTIVDNLTTQSATKALSANQGVVLKGLIDGNTSSISSLSGQVTTLSAKTVRPPNLTNYTEYTTTSSRQIAITEDSWVMCTSNYPLSDSYDYYVTQRGNVLDYLCGFKCSWFPVLAGETIVLYGTTSYASICRVYKML